MQLGGLGLALERPQPRARLALDVERSVEVVMRALQLELCATPALAVLAQSGRLLDQQPALTRLGGDQRLDPPLGDDRVHLLAQAGIGQQLEHVDQPAAGAGEAVFAFAGAVQPADDRDLGDAEPERLLGVVEHELHLGRRRGLAARRAAEDHVLHRLAADRDRRLLAERPQHRVGDVGLAGAVGADDHADARSELEPGPVRERLEALDRHRLQVHAYLRLPARPPVSVMSRAPASPTVPPVARRPSWSDRCRSRSRRRRSAPRP